jgi:hypothetical protein
MLACAFPARFRPQPLGEGLELPNLTAVPSLGPLQVIAIAQDGATTARSLVTPAPVEAESVPHLPDPVVGDSADGRLRRRRLRHPRFKSQAGRWPADLDHRLAARRRARAADRLAKPDTIPLIGTIRPQGRRPSRKMIDFNLIRLNTVYVIGSIFANFHLCRDAQTTAVAMTHQGRNRCYRRIRWRSCQPSPSG